MVIASLNPESQILGFLVNNELPAQIDEDVPEVDRFCMHHSPCQIVTAANWVTTMWYSKE